MRTNIPTVEPLRRPLGAATLSMDEHKAVRSRGEIAVRAMLVRIQSNAVRCISVRRADAEYKIGLADCMLRPRRHLLVRHQQHPAVPGLECVEGARCLVTAEIGLAAEYFAQIARTDDLKRAMARHNRR